MNSPFESRMALPKRVAPAARGPRPAHRTLTAAKVVELWPSHLPPAERFALGV
jgi:hypothetical protein